MHNVVPDLPNLVTVLYEYTAVYRQGELCPAIGRDAPRDEGIPRTSVGDRLDISAGIARSFTASTSPGVMWSSMIRSNMVFDLTEQKKRLVKLTKLEVQVACRHNPDEAIVPSTHEKIPMIGYDRNGSEQ